MSKLHIFLGSIALVLIVLIVAKFVPFELVNKAPELAQEEQAQILQQEREVGVLSQLAAARYEHKNPDFSFEKPEGYVVGVSEQEGNEVLLVSKAQESTQGFQVLISRPDERVELTPTFIQSALPGMLVQAAKKVAIDGKGVGIMFESNNEAFGGASFEIWFMADGYLYQVSSYDSFAAELQKIIGTWKF